MDVAEVLAFQAWPSGGVARAEPRGMNGGGGGGDQKQGLEEDDHRRWSTVEGWGGGDIGGWCWGWYLSRYTAIGGLWFVGGCEV